MVSRSDRPAVRDIAPPLPPLTLIQDYAGLLREAQVDQSIPVTDRLLGRYGAGSVASLSFDQGFTRAADRELLGL